MIRRLLCWLGWHDWTWQHRDDALDAIGYLMFGGLSRYDRWRTEKRLYDAMDYGTSHKLFCKHCGREMTK